MKRRIYAAYAGMALLVMLGTAMTGCVKDRDMNGSAQGDGDNVNVRLEVNVDGVLTGTPTRGMTDVQETTVSTIDVYHFVNISGSKYQAVAMAPAQGTFTEGPPSWVNATLTTYPGRDSKLVIVLNARRADNYGYTKMQTLESFLAGLVVTETGEWYTGTARPMPMYGITGAVEIKKDLPNNELTDNGNAFPLLRMHAKFNVSLKNPLDTGTFELKSVCVFNRNTRGTLPWGGTLDYTDAAVPKATVPNIPSTTSLAYMPGLAEPYYTAGTNSANPDYKKIVNKQYVFESDNASQSDRLLKTAIVVGGKFGTDTAVSYYRVDVPDNVTGGNILRNRIYDVEIQDVLGPGYETAEEAYIGAKKIEYTVSVVPWGLNYVHHLGWIEPLASSNCYMLPTGGETVAIPIYGQIRQAIAAGHLPADWINNDMKFSAEMVWTDNAAAVKWFKAYDGSALDYATLHVTPGNTEGNAVIAVFNDKNSNHIREAGEEILWSWHIWVTNYEPGKGVGTRGFMDRNLGALKNKWTNWVVSSNYPSILTTLLADDVVGMHYQWGRKDPFSPKTVTGTVVSTSSVNTLKQSIETPHGFITNWTAPTGTDSWGYSTSKKTAYDPCPTGWKVPVNGSFGAVVNWTGNAGTNGGLSFDAGFYPLPAYKSTTGNLTTGTTLLYNIAGCYWTDRYTYATGFDIAYNMASSYLNYNYNNAVYGFTVRCIKDTSVPAPFVPTLTTDSDGRKILTDGAVYNIAVTSNTEWEAYIKRGTDEVTRGDASVIGGPLLNAANGFNGGGSTATITGTGSTTITVKTVDYYTLDKLAEGVFTIVFRDKATGQTLHTAAITVWQGIAPRFSRSNIVMLQDNAGNKILTFAETIADNSTGKTVTINGTQYTQVIRANVQGVFFKWGALAAMHGERVSGTAFDVADVIWSSNGIAYTTWAALPYNDKAIATTAYNVDAFVDATYGYPGGFDEAAAKGDICRYITAQGWVQRKWRMPTIQEYESLHNETYASLGNKYAVWMTTFAAVTPVNTASSTGGTGYGLYQMSAGIYQGAAATASDPTTHDKTNPFSSRVFFPASGYRTSGSFTSPGTNGAYYSATPKGSNTYRHGFDSTVVDLTYGQSRNNNGLPIRCIRDFE